MTAWCWPITSGCRKVGSITWGELRISSGSGLVRWCAPSGCGAVERASGWRVAGRSGAGGDVLAVLGVAGLGLVGVVLVAVLADLEVGSIDRMTVLVDDLDPLEEPVERLALAHIGAYSRQLPPAFELAPH